ncbi:MAG: hypothetical protein A2284_14325 [Deltaproteobacteria bacterium RIFOXYA12_FULL_61_11]|nr:MAG: hypothetical protein A2284_14325 [Deltaproteobacteria bacterium RIFOXYA12_FULL_61_11]
MAVRFLVILTVLLAGRAQAHCQIPCGIYGDDLRLALLDEHVTTLEKAMQQIVALGTKNPLDLHQTTRWIETKEHHAKEIQSLVADYFLTQRIRPAAEAEAAAHRTYVRQLTTLHGILLAAMKARQGTDLEHIAELRTLLRDFRSLYGSTAIIPAR